MSRAWRDGRFVPGDDPTLPTIDGSVGLFETILVTAGEPLLLDAHLDRLLADAGAPDATAGAPDRAALAAACRALAREGPDPGRMRVMRDAHGVAVTLAPFAGYPAQIYAAGVAVEIAAHAGHPLGERAGTKPLPYTALIDARADAQSRGAFEVLFTDRDGALLEGSSSNLFVAFGGVLRTPPLSRPILPGVTRAEVLAAARRLDMRTEEADVFPRDLPRAEEAFLTGSLMQVVPIRRLGGVEIPPGTRGRRLRAVLFGG